MNILLVILVVLVVLALVGGGVPWTSGPYWGAGWRFGGGGIGLILLILIIVLLVRGV